ncbi:MAG: mechanosensitive ion channel family protein [Gemmatimonadota bacterium]
MMDRLQALLAPWIDSGWLPWVLGGIVATVVALLLFGVRAFVVSRLTRLAKHTATKIDDLVVEVLRKTKAWFLVLIGLSVGTSLLPLGAQVLAVLHGVVTVGFGLQAGLWLTALVGGVLRLWMSDPSTHDGAAQTTLGALKFLIFLVVWSGLFLLVLANLGIDVTALVAGLGVGGVAVALAVQSILGDLFASLSIVLDRPFAVGDFIIVDDYMGTVERVGLKTTRVRSLSGEQLIFSNANLLSTRIRNYQRMQQRRIVFSFGVTYGTPVSLVRGIPDLVRAAITVSDQTRCDRVHFKEFGDSALVFEAVYYMLVPDYNVYMDTQQRINLALMEQFAARKIEFAFPTQTLYLAKAENGGS